MGHKGDLELGRKFGTVELSLSGRLTWQVSPPREGDVFPCVNVCLR